jgi:prepilin-type N-terminal cleavage/methylation domain-containing protein
MERLRSDSGMTLPEMLVAMVIGMIVCLATFALIDTVMRRTGEITTRVDATQRGRAAMDQITRQLRSQVCVQATNPSMADTRTLYTGTATSVTFFTDLSNEAWVNQATTARNPELRQLSLESNKLIERVWAGTATGTAVAPTFAYTGYPTASTATSTRVVLNDVAQATGTAPLFRYFKYGTTAPIQANVEIAPGTGLSAADAASVARIELTYRTYRSGGKDTDRGSVVLQDAVTSRYANPNSINPKPVCS